MIQFRNATYNATGTIDVEINHPEYGWIPFTASPTDVESHGRDIYAAALLGPVSPYVPPPLDLLGYAANKRWQFVQAGTQFNGWPSSTDDISQGKVQAEVLAVNNAIRQDGEYWKFADGVFRPLTNQQVIDLATVMRAHVKNGFGLEALATGKIVNGDITTYEEIDALFAPAP